MNLVLALDQNYFGLKTVLSIMEILSTSFWWFVKFEGDLDPSSLSQQKDNSIKNFNVLTMHLYYLEL